MADPIIYSPEQSFDVVDLTFADVSIYWSAALKRSWTFQPSDRWTGDGIEGLIESFVNDSDLANVAFTWLTGAGTSRLILTLPEAIEYRECRWSYDTAGAALVAPRFEWSDDGIAWTPVSGTTAHGITIVDAGGGIESRVTRWDAPGAHVHWSANRASGTDATGFTEVFFREYEEEAVAAQSYAIFNMLNGGLELYTIIDADDLPTAASPLSIEPIFRPATFEVPTSGFDIVVKTISRDSRYGQADSDGVRRSSFTPVNLNRATYVVQDEIVLTGLSNGLNSDINIYDFARGPCSVVVNGTSGISGAYSAGGFYHNGAFIGGERFRLWNWTAHTVTIVHNDGSTTAGNRIQTLTAANINIVGNGFADFEYSGDQACFVMVLGRDSTGYK